MSAATLAPAFLMEAAPAARQAPTDHAPPAPPLGEEEVRVGTAAITAGPLAQAAAGIMFVLRIDGQAELRPCPHFPAWSGARHPHREEIRRISYERRRTRIATRSVPHAGRGGADDGPQRFP